MESAHTYIAIDAPRIAVNVKQARWTRGVLIIDTDRVFGSTFSDVVQGIGCAAVLISANRGFVCWLFARRFFSSAFSCYSFGCLIINVGFAFISQLFDLDRLTRLLCPDTAKFSVSLGCWQTEGCFCTMIRHEHHKEYHQYLYCACFQRGDNILKQNYAVCVE
jgi:hypothetical protein